MATMRALAASCLRHFWLAAGSAFVAACLAGWVRLLPWLSARSLPLGALTPFVRELLLGALQAALLLGVPLGAALSSSLFVERGEARALFALGVSPARCARTVAAALLGPALVLGLVVVGARSLRGEDPLASFIETSDAIREHCLAEPEPVAVPIPGSELSWLCGRPEPPLLVGPAPGSAGALWFSGRTLERDGDHVSVQSAQVVSRGRELLISGSADRFSMRAPSSGGGLPALDLFLSALGGSLCAALPIALTHFSRQPNPRWLPLLVGLVVGSSGLAAIAELTRAAAAEARWQSLALAIAAPVLSALSLLVLADLHLRCARLRNRRRVRLDGQTR
jgi:hypothetical protein